MSTDAFRTEIDALLKSLQEKEHTLSQLQSIIDHAPLAIALWDVNGACLFCNHYTVRLFGLAHQEHFFQAFSHLSPLRQPDGTFSAEASKRHLAQAREQGYVRFHWMHRGASGEEIPVDNMVHCFSSPDSEGGVLFVSFMHDLRTHLAGFSGESDNNGFFFNRLSHQTLFEAVAELSDEWFWVYDVREQTIQFFGKGRDILRLSATKQPFPQQVVESGIVYPDDLPLFLEFSESVKVGFHKPFDVRFVLPDRSVRYYRIIYKTTYDRKGNPLFSIGKTFDIHNQKTLEVLSRTDSLTNCLNKMTTEQTIQNLLLQEKNAFHALFIVDIDDFKAVNDNLGHHFGDLVLTDIAGKLHTHFRGEDIIGRIGGDEFVVFVKNVTSRAILERKARAIAAAFQNNYAGEHSDYKISGSIGIALYPGDGTTYEALYKAADKALYHSKTQGKDRYTFYEPHLADAQMQKLTTVENAERIASTYFDSELMSTIFELMYEAKDVTASLNTALQLIGQRLGADRCYLFETFDEGIHYSVTYEWCSANVSRQIQNLQNISKATLGDFFDVLDAHDVLYSNDIRLIQSDEAYRLVRGQEIQSFLLVQAKGKEYTRLVLGLDDCHNSRVWSEKEINSVRYALKMISIFTSSNSRTRDLHSHEVIASLALNEQERALLEGLRERGIGFFRI